ncbi:MAG: nucleoside-triphosphatase, partial [Dehalococcoidia bacterium]|nr:nucleoside-triphosphatase [Dehalococcoidia bacterium]
DLVVIDEIGKMELFSSAFRDAVSQALAGSKPVLGALMLAPHPWADAIKRHAEVHVVVLTKQNRQEVRTALKSWLNSIAKEEEHEQDPGTDQA